MLMIFLFIYFKFMVLSLQAYKKQNGAFVHGDIIFFILQVNNTIINIINTI